MTTTTFTRHFSTVKALLEAAPSPANAGRSRKRWATTGFSEWSGASSREEALCTLLGGWAEGVARARKVLGSLSLPQVASIRRKVRWSDAGDEVSMDRVYSGDADTAWRSTERRTCPPGLQPCYRINVSIVGNASRNAEGFFWRGAVAIALADALEESGRSCEIVAYSLTRGSGEGGQDCALSVTLKRSDEPLDLSRVAAMTAHPAALRVAMFTGLYTAPFPLAAGLGAAQEDALPNPSHDPVITVKDIFTQEQAVAFIKATTQTI